MIYLIWSLFICCGVANGIIYENVSAPVMYGYMSIVIVVAIALLIVHRIYTRDWDSPIDEGDKHYPTIFTESFAILFLVAIASLLFAQSSGVVWGAFVGAMTTLVSVSIASVWEMRYA